MWSHDLVGVERPWPNRDELDPEAIGQAATPIQLRGGAEVLEAARGLGGQGFAVVLERLEENFRAITDRVSSRSVLLIWHAARDRVLQRLDDRGL